jgi:hypothetical protein
MKKADIANLTRLAAQATASLLPVASNGSTDSHGGRPEPEAKSIARGLIALEEAGDLARQIREKIADDGKRGTFL